MFDRTFKLILGVSAIIAMTTVLAQAAAEYRLGGVDGNPWQVVLSLEGAGESVVLDEDGQVVRRAAVGVMAGGQRTPRPCRLGLRGARAIWLGICP